MSEKYIQKFIQVDDIHTIAYREYGNSFGIPILMLHGGPGGHQARRARADDQNVRQSSPSFHLAFSRRF